jgi:transcriptional regulator with XRE-family HTH domain
MIFTAQLRAARGIVGWHQSQLAEASGVALSTIRRMETSEVRLRGNAESIWKVRRALENAGVVFIEQSEEGGPGVRLKDQI